MCTLAHIFEAAGLSTVVLTTMRDIAERMKVPRALYTDFPVGRPLGKPRDKTFQFEVLKAAFCLLEAPEGPGAASFGSQNLVANASSFSSMLESLDYRTKK